MKNYYKISEFAALCGLSRDTLLHYDRIGILKPAFVAPSGYRYYTLSPVHHRGPDRRSEGQRDPSE